MQSAPMRITGRRTPDMGLRRMKLTAAAVFALLCVAGLATMNGGEKMRELQVAVRQMMEEVSRQQLPDAVPVSEEAAKAGTIVAEDKLTEAIKRENALPAGAVPTVGPVPEETLEPLQDTTPESIAEPTTEPTQEPTPEPTLEPTPEPTPEPVSYTIKKGDTLIGICIRQYGSDKRVSEICAINAINDPDDIKVGQKILLP